MARTVKPEEYAQKRNQIVEVAMQRMMFKGFHNLAIREILDEIHISSGAFHHYFESRDALLDAILERIMQISEKELLPLTHDPHLSAMQKLTGFFTTLDRIRVDRKEDVARLNRVWFADENANVRKKMDEAVLAHRAPLLNQIVRQGVQEGVFTTEHPEHSGEVILSLLNGMGSAHIRLLNQAIQEQDEACIGEIADEIIDVYRAFMTAVERVLGAPADSLGQIDTGLARLWVNTVREIR
ncbi:MAG: TetR/AcrR family transcriptional regulator [Chloroflexi bacterium]|nr:TetR/AcrR family transcriptional regulator [Chloroflexota bacterium]